MFFSFMRSSKIGAYSESDFYPTRNLTTQDVAIDNLANPQILKIRLKCSKTNPFREGSDIFLARTHDELCPVTAMLTWLVKRNAKPAAKGPLFVLQSGAPLTCNSFIAHFKEALMAVHIDPTGFSRHSFRIGAATTASRQGLPKSIIKRLERWKSTAYQRYIQATYNSLGKSCQFNFRSRSVTQLGLESLTWDAEQCGGWRQLAI